MPDYCTIWLNMRRRTLDAARLRRADGGIPTAAKMGMPYKESEMAALTWRAFLPCNAQDSTPRIEVSASTLKFSKETAKPICC